MNGRPVVVTISPLLPPPRRANIADVLIAPPDHHSASEHGAELLRRYPNATLVLVPDQVGRALVVTRDGSPVRVRLPGTAPQPRNDAIRILAVLLFDLIAGGHARLDHPPETGSKVVGAT